MSCPGCGAPLALHEEGPPASLDASISLDRRGPERAAEGLPALDRTLSDLTPGPPRSPARLAPPPPARPGPEGAHPLPGQRPPPLRAPVPPAPVSFAPVAPGAAPPPPAAHPPAPVAPPAAPPVADGLPDVDVDALEIQLRRPAPWRRAAAWVVDALPFLLLAAYALRALGGIGADPRAPLDPLVRDGGAIALPVLAGVAILAFTYQTLSHALAGATLGKWLFRLRVVGPDGRRPSFARSAARSALAAVSVLLLGLGLLLALFTRSERALHDLVAGTWVVEPP